MDVARWGTMQLSVRGRCDSSCSSTISSPNTSTSSTDLSSSNRDDLLQRHNGHYSLYNQTSLRGNVGEATCSHERSRVDSRAKKADRAVRVSWYKGRASKGRLVKLLCRLSMHRFKTWVSQMGKCWVANQSSRAGCMLRLQCY